MSNRFQQSQEVNDLDNRNQLNNFISGKSFPYLKLHPY